jgi:hypothetical protein
MLNIGDTPNDKIRYAYRFGDDFGCAAALDFNGIIQFICYLISCTAEPAPALNLLLPSSDSSGACLVRLRLRIRTATARKAALPTLTTMPNSIFLTTTRISTPIILS